MVRGFEPSAGADACVLILGTAPSVRSLELQQYYAHPRNAFWPIMSALFADGEEPDYSARVDLLVSARVALWDVLRAAERPGSLDSSIAAATAVPNDIGRFLAGHSDIAHVFYQRRCGAGPLRASPIVGAGDRSGAGIPAAAVDEPG